MLTGYLMLKESQEKVGKKWGQSPLITSPHLLLNYYGELVL